MKSGCGDDRVGLCIHVRDANGIDGEDKFSQHPPSLRLADRRLDSCWFELPSACGMWCVVSGSVDDGTKKCMGGLHEAEQGGKWWVC